jgi:hypothetical protein
MAIVQISRIQHRKGLQQDLPQLASAELGWSVDTRQLYIGNGTIAEGAPTEGVTEVLTQYTDLLAIADQYTFKGSESGYTSQTGPTALSPIQRTLQAKLDDAINVKDFGAVGNGIVDDTLAIQRAFDEVLFGGFAATQPRLRRPIYFPAGTFIISNSLKIPAYLTIIGAGVQKTTIQQTSNSYPLFQLKDSSGQIDNAYGTLGAATVKFVVVSDMTLDNAGSNNILKLDSCDNMYFHRVQFKGDQVDPGYVATLANTQSGVYAIPRDASKDINNINFIDCLFTGCHYGLLLNANNVKIIGCDFTQCYQGVWVGATGTAPFNSARSKNIKISNCTFEDIHHEAIYVNTASATNVTNVLSVGNWFGEIGTGYAGAGAAVSPVITFQGTGNSSVGDDFERPDVDHGVYARVSHSADTMNVSLSGNVGLQTGMITRGTGRTLTLAAGQTSANTGIVLTGVTNGAASIHYTLERPSATAYRHGVLDVVFNGTDVQYTDEYVEYPNGTYYSYPGPTGVTLSVVNVSSGIFKINYTSDGSGTGTLTYSITKFQV